MLTFLVLIFTIIIFYSFFLKKQLLYSLFNIFHPTFSTLGKYLNYFSSSRRVIKVSENFSTINWHLFNEKRKKFLTTIFKK